MFQVPPCYYEEGFNAFPAPKSLQDWDFSNPIGCFVGARIYPARANKRQVPVFEVALADLSGG